MAKSHGLGANFYYNGIDLSGDTNALSKISKSLNPLDFTGIDKLAIERKPGKLDGGIDWDSFFNPTNAHPALSGMSRGDNVASYMHKAADLGTPVASIVCKQMSYDPTRAEDGGLTASVETLANSYWLDWGYSLTTGKATLSGAGNGTGVDFANQGAPAAFGLQAYLHVFAFTGTSATIVLQGSSDNAVGDPYSAITGGAFTVVSVGPTSERIATSRSLAVERYVRVSVTGTFSNLVFAVSATVNGTEYLL